MNNAVKFVSEQSSRISSPRPRAGHIFAHEWAHFRFGAQDEHGFASDPVYGPLDNQGQKPTSCTQGGLMGVWRPDW